MRLNNYISIILLFLCLFVNAQDSSRVLGQKSYEVSNHLNNVTTVVSDRKINTTQSTSTVVNHSETDIISYNDYYPYGMLMEKRNDAGDYRFGFQGQEKDDEVKGEGNSINYKYRMHDVRVGRFFAVDPLARKYPYNSVYAFSENILINAVELEGLEKKDINNDCSECLALEAEGKNTKHKYKFLRDKEHFTDINGRFFQYDKGLNSFIEVTQIPQGSPLKEDLRMEGKKREKKAIKLYNNINKFLNETVFVFDYSDNSYKAKYLHETAYGKHILLHRDRLLSILKPTLLKDKKGNYIKNTDYWAYQRYLRKNYKKIMKSINWNIINRPNHEDFKARFSFNKWRDMSLNRKVEYYQLYMKIARMTLSQWIHIYENNPDIGILPENLEKIKAEYELLHNKQDK